MHRLLGFFIFVMVMSIAGIAFAGAQILSEDFGVDSTSEPKGVFCEINGVRLMAKTPADCEKAGGAVTHVISTTVTPAGEATGNPEEEPEIQREKDKEPEAQ
jgi:hypothetical protein